MVDWYCGRGDGRIPYSRLTIVLIVTLGLLSFNLLHQIHRQNVVLSRIQQDGESSEQLVARIAALEQQLAAAKAEAAATRAARAAPPGLLAATSVVRKDDISTQGWYQRIEDIPRGSAVWVSFVNGDDKYREMMINWAYHLRKLHVPHIVVAFDDIAARNCEEEQIPHLRHVETLQSGDFRADFLKFRKMGSNKPLIVLKLLEEHGMGTVIISDVDTVWLRNPLEFLTRHPTADVLISTDCLSHWVEAVYDPQNPKLSYYHRCGHMPNSGFGRAFNTGTIIFRNRNTTLAVLREWRAMLKDDSKAFVHTERGQDFAVTDQLAFNMILERNISPITPTAEDWRVFWAFDNRLRLMALPALLFTNGHAFFYQHLPQKHDVQAYVVHCTFQRHHTPGKRARLREEGLWLLDPPEYLSEGNFLTYENDVVEYIEALARKATKPMSDLYRHFHSMSYQLAAMRDAFAFAHALNRTLILPRFVCHCDQDWYASILTKCRVDSSDLLLPFVCPLDVLLNPENLDNSPLPYRVASFLTDKRTPTQVLHSQEPVYVDASEAWVDFMRRHNVGAGNYLTMGSRAPEVAAELSTMSSVRILRFKGLRPGAFGGFGSAAADAAFDEIFKRVIASEAKWCCSGEQPISVPWITWYYILPTPLADGVAKDWQIPEYKSPPHCDQIKNGEAGQLNVGFTKQANHPCNFLNQGNVLPRHLSELFPSTSVLQIV